MNCLGLFVIYCYTRRVGMTYIIYVYIYTHTHTRDVAVDIYVYLSTETPRVNSTRSR